MKRCWLWRGIATCLLGCWLQLAQAQPLAPALTLEDALARSNQLVSDTMDQFDKAANFAACRELLEPWTDEAFLRYRKAEDPFPSTLAICRYADTGEGRARATEAEVRAWMQPWWEALRERGDPDPLRELKLVVSHHRTLQAIGLQADAAPLYDAEVSRRIDQLREHPDDKLVASELAFIASGTFGAWQFQDEVRRLHGLFARGLGEGHRYTLIILRSLAYHERFMGRPAEALAHIEKAVALAQQFQAADVMLQAHMATEHAACLAAAGQLALARQRLLAARETFLAQEPRSELNLSRIETNLAGMAMELSDFAGAIEHANLAIEHAERSGLPDMQVEARVPTATRELARLLLGDQDAASKLREVLDVTLGLEMHIGSQAFALAQYAAQRGDASLVDWAVPFSEQHIRRYRGAMQSDSALIPLMHAWRQGGFALRSGTVRPLLDRALAISLTGRSLGTLALTQFNLARSLAQSDPDTALWLYKRGANDLQQLRLGLPAGQPELHRAWLGAHEADLRQFIALLIDRGRLVEAEQAMTVLRDEESHEFSRRSIRKRDVPSQSLSYTPAESLRNAGMQTASSMAERIAADADAKMDAVNRPKLRVDYVDAKALAGIEDLTDFVHRLVDETPASSRALPQRAAKPAAIPTGKARLTYFVRDDSIDIVLQTGHKILRTRVLVARNELNRLVQSARSALGSAQIDALPPLQSLHRLLLVPVNRALLRAGVWRLDVVPDAALRYVPFAALHDGTRFAAQRFEVATRWAGSAPSPAPVSGPRAPGLEGGRGGLGGVVAFGRTQGDATHDALPGVQEELGALRSAGAKVWLDRDFTESRLRESLAERPVVVHLASHFSLDPAGEEKSFLLLGDGQSLSLSAIGAMPWQGVKLALLSACESGVSLEAGPGQALVGFASTLQRAGVENVLATLWRVSDGATAQWVEMFYAGSLQGLPNFRRKLTAGRVAATQRQWLQRFAGSSLAHPHYWASFIWLDHE